MRSTTLVTQAILVVCLILKSGGSCRGEQDIVEMMRYRCGYNSVYVLLRLSGVDCSYEELKLNGNSGSKGLSVKELAEELKRCGLPSRVIRCDIPDDVRKLSPPFIIYTNPDRSGNTIGHFLVVTKISNETIDLIDGTTSEKKEYAIAKLSNLWDGVVIIPEKDRLKSWRWLLGLVLAISGLSLALRTVTPRFNCGWKNE